jgi:hypothetical protein
MTAIPESTVTVHIERGIALDMIEAAGFLVDEATGQYVDPESGARYWHTDEALANALEVLQWQLLASR